MKMNEDKDKDKSQILIYSILLSESVPFYRIFGGTKREEVIPHMNKIAELGGTKNLFESKTPEDIDKALKKIANAVVTKYGLKMKQNS